MALLVESPEDEPDESVEAPELELVSMGPSPEPLLALIVLAIVIVAVLTKGDLW